MLIEKMNNEIYDYISLYQYFILILFPALTLAHKSKYLLSITIFIYLCDILTKFLKSLNYSDFGDINKRPSNAFNCNIINKGGDYSMKPGFPSGHTVIATFVYFLILFEFLDKNNSSKQREKLIPILLITFIAQILVPYARVKKGCHTITQVLGGILLGILIAILFKFCERKIFLNSTEYSYQKQKFLNCM